MIFQRAHDQQHHHVMTGLINRDVKPHIRPRLFCRIIGGMRGQDPGQALCDKVQFRLIGALSRHRGGGTFHDAAKFQIIIRHFAAFGQQADQGIGHASGPKLCHLHGPPLTHQQATFFERLDRIANCRARDPKLHGEVALGQKSLTGAQRSFQYEAFDMLPDCLGCPFRADRTGLAHAHGSLWQPSRKGLRPC